MRVLVLLFLLAGFAILAETQARMNLPHEYSTEKSLGGKTIAHFSVHERRGDSKREVPGGPDPQHHR